jgi:Spy/CpxP family protein refolding chaperone
MSGRWSVRAQAVLVLVLVALLGALLGVLGQRLLAQQAPTPADEPHVGVRPLERPPLRPGHRARGALRFAERLDEELELTPAQRAAIDSILAEERARVRQLTAEVQPRFRQIAQQTRARIDRVLTDAQRAELRRIRQERIRHERLLRLGEPLPGSRPPR